MGDKNTKEDLFSGLRELVASAFPKSCNTCGRVFNTAEDFLKGTQDLPSKRSCIKQAIEDDGSTLLEVFRNCTCGSTLMDEFSDRRDLSEKGLKRRAIYDRMLEVLLNRGIDLDVAKIELKKAARGKRSELIENHFNRKKND